MELSDFALGFITIILTCAVPWGYKVHGRLTAIEAIVKDNKTMETKLDFLRDFFHKMDVRLTKIEKD